MQAVVDAQLAQACMPESMQLRAAMISKYCLNLLLLFVLGPLQNSLGGSAGVNLANMPSIDRYPDAIYLVRISLATP